MNSFITLPIQKVLFQNKNWSIKLLKNGNEITISNGYTVCYGYPDLNKGLIRYDVINFPKYISDKALKLCKQHNINFY